MSQIDRIALGNATLDDFLVLFVERYDQGRGLVPSLLHALNMCVPKTPKGIDGAATMYAALVDRDDANLADLVTRVKELEEIEDRFESLESTIDALQEAYHG